MNKESQIWKMFLDGLQYGDIAVRLDIDIVDVYTAIRDIRNKIPTLAGDDLKVDLLHQLNEENSRLRKFRQNAVEGYEEGEVVVKAGEFDASTTNKTMTKSNYGAVASLSRVIHENIIAIAKMNGILQPEESDAGFEDLQELLDEAPESDVESKEEVTKSNKRPAIPQNTSS